MSSMPSSFVPAGYILAVVLAAVFMWQPVQCADQPPNPLPCTCTDIDVRKLFISPVEFNCWQQYTFGTCGEKFMFDTIKEIPEGYCEITCGRCPCCSSLAAAAEAAGLTDFVWAMNRTYDLAGLLSAPGFAATLMAPDNNAMKNLIDKLGGKQRIESDAGVRGKLSNIMSYHVVRPLPGYEAWTSPFLVPGTQVTTWKNDTLQIVEAGTGGGIKLQGAGSSADITEKDIYACKGYINKLNWFLLPQGESLQ